MSDDLSVSWVDSTGESTIGRWTSVLGVTLVEGPPDVLRYVTERLVKLLRDDLHALGWSWRDLTECPPAIEVKVTDDYLTRDVALIAQARTLVLLNPNPFPRITLRKHR